LNPDPDQTSLLSRVDAGDKLATPPLATCSYFEYTRPMGTPVRITRMAPRGVALPNPRWTERTSWPSATILAPGAAYFHKGLTAAEFADRYLDDLNSIGAERIAKALRGVPDDGTGQLVLLCFEKDPAGCHRRVFAEWWADLTGQQVPELTP
jgi:uncharacterized protein YeaO (DUF488 family)